MINEYVNVNYTADAIKHIKSYIHKVVDMIILTIENFQFCNSSSSLLHVDAGNHCPNY